MCIFVNIVWSNYQITCFFHAVCLCRCKKIHFYNVSDGEIVDRLQALAYQEGLEVEEGALSLIASRSNGSIPNAEIMLDQLSLVDKKVSLASVQKHVSNSTRASDICRQI